MVGARQVATPRHPAQYHRRDHRAQTTTRSSKDQTGDVQRGLRPTINIKQEMRDAITFLCNGGRAMQQYSRSDIRAVLMA